ncbi:MAG: hypothetical protein IT252_12100 [Chitinophagaceae bacterium]|nr:hypothetical protein [Chitinophagaceae bacterium]
MSTKVEGQSVSPNDAKPDVAGSPVSSSPTWSEEAEQLKIATAIRGVVKTVNGLSVSQIQQVLKSAENYIMLLPLQTDY